MNLEELRNFAAAVNQNAHDKLWWEEPRTDPGLVALIHSELSEALEAMREGNPASQKIPNFSCVEEEMADTIIRILDFCEERGYDIVGAIIAKAEYNKTREPRHGKKF